MPELLEIVMSLRALKATFVTVSIRKIENFSVMIQFVKQRCAVCMQAFINTYAFCFDRKC